MTEYLLWLDFETTGLAETDVPIEVAAVLTTADTLAEIDGYETLIWTDPIKIETCAAFDMHQTSGLITAWRDGEKTGLGWVDTDLTVMIDRQCGDSLSLVTLAGSGIGTFDLPIIKRLLPNLTAHLTYHVHDVGVMRRAYRRATGHDLTERTEPAHRAMADVQQSLAEGRAFADLFRGVASHA